MSESDADSIRLKGNAYHEAGHAILQVRFKMALQQVSILPQSENIGGVSSAYEQHPFDLQQQGVFFEGTKEQDSYICHHIMISQAGKAAQLLHCPESFEPDSDRFDRAHVKVLQNQLRGYLAWERQARIEALEEFTRELLNHPMCVAAVHAVARALLEHKELLGDRATKIIRREMPGELECPHCASYEDYE